jgi:hypothetical protein
MHPNQAATLIKKGEVRNPGGRPKMPEHLRIIKAFTPEEIQRIIAKYGRLTLEEVCKLEKDESVPMIERIFAKMFAKAYTARAESAVVVLKFLLDRSIGKVPEVIHAEYESDPGREDLRKLSLEELMLMIRKMLPNETIKKIG